MGREAYITGLGTQLPDRLVSNSDLVKVLDTSDEWIRDRTGIGARYFAGPNQATSDLAIGAGRQAMEDAGVAPEDIDMVIVGTFTPDYQFPPTACIVQHALGCTKAAAFDIEAACTGWIAAHATAAMYVRGGGAETVLVIGADTASSVLNMEDRTTAVLFGDAGAASVVQARPEGTPGLRMASTYLGADGSGVCHLMMPAGGSRKPASVESVEAREHYIQMEGRATYKFAVKAMADCVTQCLKRADIEVADVTRVIPHQANLRIIEASAKRLDLSMDRYVLNIHKYGNTVAASIGLALHEAREEGLLKPGDSAALVGMGAGLTWGGIALTWVE